MSRLRDRRLVTRLAEAAGLTVSLTANGHLRACGRGVLIILPSNLPTDRHRRNAEALLARAIRIADAIPAPATTTRGT